jgi:hypothetical protein
MFSNIDKLSDAINRSKHLLPKDFDYQKYLEYNPDLQDNGINNEDLAKLHFLIFGKKENRFYKSPLSISHIDSDFDEQFYLSEYPDVQAYYKNVIGITQKEKLFHHYIHYGKNEGRFKNKIEQDNSLIDTNNYINDLIDVSELINPINQLQCICLMTTSKEIKNGKFDFFVKQIINQTTFSKINKDVHFKIVINNSKSKPNISQIKKIFPSISIENLQLNSKEDIYQSSLKNNQQLPYYGLKSGPNTTFFKSIELCKDYNTTLLLETDCILNKDWLQSIYKYVQYSNGFLVSGATYDGTVFSKAGSAMMNHINGGVALYATGNHILNKVLQLLSKFLHEQIHYNSPGLAYDYAFKILIDHNLNDYTATATTREIWKFINRNYIINKLIFNCSTKNDINLDEKKLLIKYNFAILHKKV